MRTVTVSMRYKLAVLLGQPPSPRHDPERAADEGALGDLLVEGDSLAWNLNPVKFPALTTVDPVEVMIDGRVFSLWDPPGVEFAERIADDQVAEMPTLAQGLMERLGYGAAAAGILDLDELVFRDLYWFYHRDPRDACKFLACCFDPVRTRLVLALADGASPLDPPSSDALQKACESDMECATVLGPLARQFADIEAADEGTLAAQLRDFSSFSPRGVP